MDIENQDPLPEDPEEIFADFLQRLEAGEEIDIERVFAAHPACAEELQRYHAEWNRWASVLEGAAPGPQSIEGVPAEPEGESDEPPRISSEVLRQFAIGSDERHRYRFRSHLSSGGQGSILKVWDTELRRQLAMKLMLGEQAANEGETQAQYERKLGRFLDEAQITGQLDHPGVIPVHELGVSSSGRAFFTMRLVRGRHFGEVIDELHRGEQGQTLIRCVGVLQRICETMAFAHSRGIVHRDLKPENVMVGPFGEVYVMDWGLARVLGKEDQRDLRIVGEERDLGSIDTVRKDAKARDPESPLFTADGAAIGTPMYMSPEQARGELEVVGPRSDVYAVGAMIYHLLAGHAPYLAPGTNASAYAVWRWVMEGPPRPITEIAPNAPEELVAICVKAMAREVDERYESTKDLLDDLQAYAEGRVVQAHRTGALVELRKWVARNRGTAAALAAAVFLAIAAPITVALVVNAKNDMITQQQARLHMQVAELAAQRGDGREVLESLEAALSAGYEDPTEIAWRRADAQIALYRHEEAQAALEALCERGDLGKHAGAIYLRRGHLLLHTWDGSTEGITWVYRALEAGLNEADTALSMAYTARTMPEAKEHCRTAIGHEPHHYLANSLLLSLLAVTGDREGSARQATVIETLFPEDPTPAVYSVLLSALEGRSDLSSLEDPDLIGRMGEGSLEVMRGVATALEMIGPILRGEETGSLPVLRAAGMMNQLQALFGGATQDPHRCFDFFATPAMPLVKDSYARLIAVLLHQIFFHHEYIETMLCNALGFEKGTLIESLFGEELVLSGQAEMEATLRESIEINGDGLSWMSLGDLIMARPLKGADKKTMLAKIRDAEYAYRMAYESTSVVPSIAELAGPKMVRCQAILGMAPDGLNDVEMLESATRNLEQMVYMNRLTDLSHGYLEWSADNLQRADLALLTWRQAIREKPDSAEVQRKLAERALMAGHWAEAAQAADAILQEDPKDEKALQIRASALEQGGEWLTVMNTPPADETTEDHR